MLNSTTQSTKSGGPLAGAWAVTQAIGDDGYAALTARVLEAVDLVVAGVERLPQLRLVARPDSTLVALSTDDTLDPFTLTDELVARGWYVQPQLSFAGLPATVHLSLSAATLPHVPELLDALGAAVDAAVAAGPVAVDPGIADFVRSLDATTLTDEEFDGLLQFAGLAGGDAALPERMAPVNALLDLASPSTREAVLVAFLDRLSRPAR
jgi:hypothetical protein